MEIQITPVTTADLNELQQISRQTFYEAFKGDNTEADMTKYLAEGFAIEKLTAEFENPESTFYFASVNNEVIAYLKLNTGKAQNEPLEYALEIERIYVLQKYVGQKVGQALYQHAIDQAEQLQLHTVWLGVWEHNARAIAFYKKNGFVEFDKHIFLLGDDPQTDILMKKSLGAE